MTNHALRVVIPVTALLCFVSVFGSAQDSAPASATPIVATMDAGAPGDPISPYLYGMFIEHLGTLINHGLWSEMLDDRKFFFPITSGDEATFRAILESGDVELRPLIAIKHWRPVGPDTVVIMDREHPFVGEQSPRITVAPDAEHGIRQSGLGLRQGKTYIGRVVVSGTPGVKVRIRLVWGDAPGDRRNHRCAQPSDPVYDLSIPTVVRSKLGTRQLRNRRFRSRLFPYRRRVSDAVRQFRGFRKDTTSLIRGLKTGLWRLPGGNFLSDHDWRNAIGDPDKRPPTWDYAWHSMQPNDVGIDELMTLCQLIQVQPYITVNAGLEDDHSAADLVEYVNGSAQTRLGKLRAANGHAAPYHVKYWDVGNEPYGFWQIGHTAIQYYALKHNAFATAMLKVDPSITILASGAMPDEVTTTGNSARIDGKVQVEYGSPEDWTGGLLARSWGHFDGLSEHWYANSGKRYDLDVAQNSRWRFGTENGYVPVSEPLIDWASASRQPRPS